MCLDSITGGGGKAPPASGNSGSTVISNSLPPEILARFTGLMDQGKAASDKAYEGYTGARVAGFTPDQQSGFQMARDAAGSYAGDLNQARNYAGIAGNAITPTVGTFDSSQMDRYGNPFNQQVIDATRNEINRSYDINGQGIAGNAANAGAFGGDRATIANSENDRNRANSLATAIGSLNAQNFSQAQNQFNTEQNRGLAARETDSANAARAAGQFQGIGAASQGLGLQGAGTLLGIGSQQQGQAQQQANVDYSNFLEKRDYGKTQANFLSGIYHGFPVNSVGTQTITGPTPSILGQAGGALTALGGSGAFGQSGWLTGSNGNSIFSGFHNGGIVGYADGGALITDASATAAPAAPAPPKKITHSGPPWLDDVGGYAGQAIGSIFFGPIGGMAGKMIGKKVGAGFGDLFDGNWEGLGNDAGVLDSFGNFNPMGATQETMAGGMGGGMGGGIGGMFGGLFGGGGAGGAVGGFDAAGMGEMGMSAFARDGGRIKGYADDGYVDPNDYDGSRFYDPRYPAGNVRPDVWGLGDNSYGADYTPMDPLEPGGSTYYPGVGYGPAGNPPVADDIQPTPQGIGMNPALGYPEPAGPPAPQQAPRPKMVPRAGEGGQTVWQDIGQWLRRPSSPMGDMTPEQESAVRRVPVQQVVQERMQRAGDQGAQQAPPPVDIAGDPVPAPEAAGAQAAELPQGGIAGAPIAGTGVPVDTRITGLEPGGNGYGIGSADMQAPRVSLPAGPRGGSGSGPSAPEAGPSRATSQPSARPNTNGTDARGVAPVRGNQSRQGQNTDQPPPGQGARITGNGGIAGTPTAGMGTGGLGDAQTAERVSQEDLNKTRRAMGLPAAAPTRGSNINLPLLMMGAAMMKSKSPSLMGSLGEGIEAFGGTKIAQDSVAAKNAIAIAHIQQQGQQHRERMQQMDVTSRRQYEYHLQQIEMLKNSRAETAADRRARDAQMGQHQRALEQIMRDNGEARAANAKTPEERADERADRAEASFKKTAGKDPISGEITPQAQWALEDHIIRTQPKSTNAEAYKAALESPQPVPGGPETRRRGQVYDTPKGALRWNGSGWVQP